MNFLNYSSFLLARLWGWVSRQQLFAGEHVVRPWPANLQEQDRAFFAKNREYSLPPSWLLRLREVSLYWDGSAFHGLHLYPETLVLPDKPQHNWRGLLYIHLRMSSHRLSSAKQYILVHDAWSESYYHWMVDALPRLLAVQEHLTGSKLLLSNTCNHDYQRQTLAALGVADIEYLQPETRYVVHNLLVPSRLARVASHNPTVMRNLRALLLDKFPILPQANFGERLYISRARAFRRKVTNEAEVMAYMRKQGFAIVQLEDYSYAEQVSIMAQVRYLVSIHGAGLTNILFMPTGSRMLELQMQDDGTNHYYYTLAADLDVDYYYQFCPPDDPSLSVQDANLTVSMAELERTVTQMMTD